MLPEFDDSAGGLTLVGRRSKEVGTLEEWAEAKCSSRTTSPRAQEAGRSRTGRTLYANFAEIGSPLTPTSTARMED